MPPWPSATAFFVARVRAYNRGIERRPSPPRRAPAPHSPFVQESPCSDRCLCIALALLASVALAQTAPPGYPADYAQTIAAANKEGKVVIYSALDTKAAQPLIKDFNALYPGIKVEYSDLNSTELYNRFIAEVGVGPGLGRRDVELGDGPAGEARRRGPGACLPVAGGVEAAVVGRLQEPGVRHDVRACGVHLQQAAGDRPTKSRRTTRPSPS